MTDSFVKEDVPGFRARLGDQVFQGSNNSTVVLGRDRARKGRSTITDGFGDETKSGSILAVVGRSSEDPNFDSDSAFSYASMKCKVDEALDLDIPGQNRAVGACYVVKSDHVRAVGRQTLRFSMADSSASVSIEKNKVSLTSQNGSAVVEISGNVVDIRNTSGVSVKIEGDSVTIKGAKVNLGNGSDPALLTKAFIRHYMSHGHSGNGAGPPILPNPLNPKEVLSSVVFVG